APQSAPARGSSGPASLPISSCWPTSQSIAGPLMGRAGDTPQQHHITPALLSIQPPEDSAAAAFIGSPATGRAGSSPGPHKRGSPPAERQPVECRPGQAGEERVVELVPA